MIAERKTNHLCAGVVGETASALSLWMHLAADHVCRGADELAGCRMGSPVLHHQQSRVDDDLHHRGEHKLVDRGLHSQCRWLRKVSTFIRCSWRVNCIGILLILFEIFLKMEGRIIEFSQNESLDVSLK